MSRTARNVLIVLLGLGGLALVIFLALPPSQSPPLAPLPNPNGYDIFVKAGKLIATEVPDLATLSREELQALVLTNAAALKLARSGLAIDCRIPPMAPGEAATGTHLSDLSRLKRLAQAFTAEGKLAELENRPADAVTAYLDTIRLGHESCRGGVLIDALVGIAVEAMGTAQIEKLTPTLDAMVCRRIATVLEAAEAHRESVETVLQQERAWTRRNYGIRGQLVWLLNFNSVRKTEQSFAARSNAQQIRANALMVKLAARAYELEHGARPQGFADLVPAYLKAVPLDPATGTNMLYLP